MTSKTHLMGVGLLAVMLLGHARPVLAREKNERADVSVTEMKRVSKSTQDQAKEESSRFKQSTLVTQGLEKKLTANIDKTLQYLKQTAHEMAKDSPSRLDLLEKVINLSLEQAGYIAGQEQDDYASAWQAWADKGKKGPTPKLDTSRSSRYWKELVDTANEIQADYPKSPHGDQVTFNKAIALQLSGQDIAAAHEFDRLIAMYPNSSVTGDANFTLGEYYFDKNDFRSATSNYQATLRYPQGRNYGWALFKLGWCYFNLEDYAKSLDYWKQTVAFANQSQDEKNQRLRDEALHDSIFGFAELKQIDPAIQFLRKEHGEKHISKFLELLATTYSQQGNFQDAKTAWRKLLSLYPAAPEAFAAQKDLVSIAYEERNFPDLWTESTKLGQAFLPGSKWADKNPTLAEDTQKNVFLLLQYYPKMLNKEAQKNNNNLLFDEAKKGYRLFLKAYPNAKEAVEIKEYLGDIEYYQENYREAGKIYLEICLLGKDNAVTYDQNGNVANNIHQRSALNMLDAYSKAFLPELQDLMKTTPDFSKAPAFLSTNANNFIKACAFYLKSYPDDAKTQKNCDTFQSEIYFRAHNKEKAMQFLWKVATTYPNDKEGPAAVENLIPLYKKDLKGLEAAAKKLLAIPAYKNGPLGAKLSETLQGMDLAAIAQEASDSKRAKMYEEKARANPSGKDADKLWNNAAVDYLKGGYTLAAMGAFAAIAKGYPQSEVYGTALLQLGALAEARFDYDQASDAYLQYAAKNAGKKEGKAAGQRACLLLVAASSPKASTVCVQVARAAPEDGAILLDKLIAGLAWQNDTQGLINLVQNVYVREFKPSANQLILAYFKIYRTGGASAAQAASTMVQVFSRSANDVSGEALRAIGELVFTQLQGPYNAYLGLQLKGGGVPQLQGSIQTMLQQAQALEQGYNQVFATKDAYWGVAAFFQLGSIYEHFAKELKNPPAIQGASPKDVKAQLQGSADEITAKAKNFYNLGMQTAKQFSVYNSWQVQIFNALNKLNKKKQTFEEWIVTPDIACTQS